MSWMTSRSHNPVDQVPPEPVAKYAGILNSPLKRSPAANHWGNWREVDGEDKAGQAWRQWCSSSAILAGVLAGCGGGPAADHAANRRHCAAGAYRYSYFGTKRRDMCSCDAPKNAPGLQGGHGHRSPCIRDVVERVAAAPSPMAVDGSCVWSQAPNYVSQFRIRKRGRARTTKRMSSERAVAIVNSVTWPCRQATGDRHTRTRRSTGHSSARRLPTAKSNVSGQGSIHDRDLAVT